MRCRLCLLAFCVLYISLAAKDMIRTPSDVPVLGELEEYLVQEPKQQLGVQAGKL